MPSVFDAYNLLIIIADHTSRRALGSLDALSVVPYPYQFTKGDTVRGSLYLVVQSGLQNPPLYRIICNADSIALTDGNGVVYATADAIEQLGGDTDPHLGFWLNVDSIELEDALAATTPQNPSIPAFIEARVTDITSLDGGLAPQDEVVIREPCNIFNTALPDVPGPPPMMSTVRREFHPEIVALLTSDNTPALDGLPTANIYAAGSLVEIVIMVDGSRERQEWQFLAGAAAGDGQVAPLDYNLATNNFYWLKVG